MKNEKDISSVKLPIAFRVGSKRMRYTSVNKITKDIDHQIHIEKSQVRRQIKAANEVGSFKLQLLKELSQLPTAKKVFFDRAHESSILDTYYSWQYKLPEQRALQDKNLTPSANTHDTADNMSISKDLYINYKSSALDFARSIKPVFSAKKDLACFICFQTRLTHAIDCGNRNLLCIECVKSN